MILTQHVGLVRDEAVLVPFAIEKAIEIQVTSDLSRLTILLPMWREVKVAFPDFNSARTLNM